MDERNRHALLITKFFRVHRRGILYRDDARNLLRRTMEAAAASGEIEILAFAMLPHRVDLLVADTPGVHSRLTLLFGYFTRRFNARYRRRGMLFRTGYIEHRVRAGEIGRVIVRLHSDASPFDSDVRRGSEWWSSERAYRGETCRVTSVQLHELREAVI